MTQGEWKWPALKGVRLYDPEDITKPNQVLRDFMLSLRQDSQITMSGLGTHVVHETEQGGIQHWAPEKVYVSAFFERRMYLPYQSIPGTRVGGSYLYLLVWLGPYMKGTVFHCGFQYPHAHKFRPTEMETAARMAYMQWARKLYELSNLPMIGEIVKFQPAASTRAERQIVQDVSQD